MTQICVSKLATTGSVNGLSSGRRQAIIWTNAGILLIAPLGTNFSEILIKIYAFSFNTMRLKMSSGKWRPFSLGLNVLTHWGLVVPYRTSDLGATLIHVMAWCQTVPSQNQYWLDFKCNSQQWTSVISFIKIIKFSKNVCHFCVNTLLKVETKWLPFCRWHFQIHFLAWKLLDFDSNFTEICS